MHRNDKAIINFVFMIIFFVADNACLSADKVLWINNTRRFYPYPLTKLLKN